MVAGCGAVAQISRQATDAYKMTLGPVLDSVIDTVRSLWLRVIGKRRTEIAPSRVALGREGEKIAERYLRREGFRIVARNFRARGAEIDLVAMDHGTLVFIEVKRRTGNSAGAPEEAVNRRKQERIRRAAEIFANGYKAGSHPVRFDVIALSGPGNPHLEHLKDAF